MARYTIAAAARHAYGAVARSSRHSPSGSQKDTRKNPHAIAVGSGPRYQPSYWYITLMVICGIARRAIYAPYARTAPWKSSAWIYPGVWEILKRMSSGLLTQIPLAGTWNQNCDCCRSQHQTLCLPRQFRWHARGDCLPAHVPPNPHG